MSDQPQNDDIRQYMPIKNPIQKYYTVEEVSLHNSANDCWVVLFGEVYDLTALIQKNIESIQYHKDRKINKTNYSSSW